MLGYSLFSTTEVHSIVEEQALKKAQVLWHHCDVHNIDTEQDESKVLAAGINASPVRLELVSPSCLCLISLHVAMTCHHLTETVTQNGKSFFAIRNHVC